MFRTICIASDWHSNLEAATTVVEYWKEKHPNAEYFSLGDVVGYGPDPLATLKKVISTCGSNCLTGNHEELVLDEESVLAGDEVSYSAEAGRFLSMHSLGIKLPENYFLCNEPCSMRPQVASINSEHPCVETMRKWPKTLKTSITPENSKWFIEFFHACPSDCGKSMVWDYLCKDMRIIRFTLFEKLKRYFVPVWTKRISQPRRYEDTDMNVMDEMRSKRPKTKIAFVGHTHEPCACRFNDAGKECISIENETEIEIDLDDEWQYIINPGSVGKRNKTGYFHEAWFAVMKVMNNNKIRIKFVCLKYDSNKTAEKLQNTKLYLYQVSEDGTQIHESEVWIKSTIQALAKKYNPNLITD